MITAIVGVDDVTAETRYNFRTYTADVFRIGFDIGDHTYVCIKKEEKSKHNFSYNCN